FCKFGYPSTLCLGLRVAMMQARWHVCALEHMPVGNTVWGGPEGSTAGGKKFTASPRAIQQSLTRERLTRLNESGCVDLRCERQACDAWARMRRALHGARLEEWS